MTYLYNSILETPIFLICFLFKYSFKLGLVKMGKICIFQFRALMGKSISMYHVVIVSDIVYFSFEH